MLSFSTDKELLATGIDSEHIARFTRFSTGEERPSPLIFSPREVEHCLSLSDPAIGLCASFCCKEAVYKALKQPYNLNACELFWEPAQKQYYVTLPDDLYLQYGSQETIAQVTFPSEEECLVTVFLLR